VAEVPASTTSSIEFDLVLRSSKENNEQDPNMVPKVAATRSSFRH